MRSISLSFAAALPALALASPAFAAVSDFRLPTERPQPPSDVQGPIAPDVPASRRRVTTPVPTPSARVEQTPATATPPIEVPAELQPAPAAANSRPVPAPAPSNAPAATATSAPLPAQPAAERAAATPVGTSTPPPPSAATVATPQASQGGWPWLWLLVAVTAALAALAAAGWAIQRLIRRPLAPVAAPQIERPRIAPSPASPSARASEPLEVSLEPVRLSLTLVNATLAYRLELANRGSTALTGLSIGADMISAHASISREEQMSGPRPGNGSGQMPAQRIERIEPGERRVVEGEFRLPFRQIVPIRQGDAALLLPLARFRLECEGAAPMVRTFAIGQPGDGNGLQPFRLDQGPRIYPRLTQHAFA